MSPGVDGNRMSISGEETFSHFFQTPDARAETFAPTTTAPF